jgi:hypothetical protein
MKDKVLQFLIAKGEAAPHEIAESTGLSRQYVQRKLLDLLDQKEVIKIGRPPLVFYQIIEKLKDLTDENVNEADREFLKGQFIEITEDGRLLEGLEAFNHWCQKRKLPVVKTISEYRHTIEKYSQFVDKDGFIDGTEKIRTTKGMLNLHLDALYYLDFYAIERFGKTLMGQLLHFAKQGQNKKLSLRLIQLSAQKINRLISILKVEAVGFVPPTIRRDVQFMTLLEKNIQLDVPLIKLIKVKGDIIVPQKALSKIEDRILNARRSIVTSESKQYKRVLLIDDAVGSGATLNETAGKLKQKGVAAEVFGVAITGSYKGFEVITEA